MKKYQYTINGVTYDVAIKSVEDDNAEVEVNGVVYTVGYEAKSQMQKPTPVVQPRVATPPPAAQPRKEPPANAQAGGVPSPLPGTIVKILVKEGDQVKVGQPLLILEAMKMENEIEALQAGTVTSIAVAQGDTVMEGDILVNIGG